MTHNIREIGRSGGPTRSKNRKTAFAVFIIFLASLFAGVVLLNQSRTIALNFEKARLEEKIKKLTIANTQAESELVENINLEIVRKAAVEMGLMEPAAKQIRILVLPEEDTLEIDKADNGK